MSVIWTAGGAYRRDTYEKEADCRYAARIKLANREGFSTRPPPWTSAIGRVEGDVSSARVA